MSNKRNRFSELEKIHPLARIDHRHLMNEKGELPYMANLSRKERRKLAAQSLKTAKQYTKILHRLATSGAGFSTDQFLRQMAIEYTHRYASSGTSNQPVSFNYFEPFCRIKLINDAAPYMDMTKEFDHLFYASDFFDYITSSDSDGFELESLYDLPEEKTFHFSINGDVNDISFLNAENREFVISGFSMIRHGSSLYWYLIGGETLTKEEWKLRCSDQAKVYLDSIPPSKRAFLSESIEEAGSHTGAPLSLEGTSTAIKTIIAGEMDLKEKKHIARCYMTEYENSFPIFCDDPEVLIGINDKEQREIVKKNMMEHINKSTVMWSLAEGFFQLPSYFCSRVPIEKKVLVKSGKRLSKKKGGRGLNKRYKMVSAVEVTDEKTRSTILRVNLPHYEIETEGHWRRLMPSATGHDRNGNEIRGKTWINSSNEWKESIDASGTIFVKDSIASAKLKISEYQRASIEVKKKSTNSNDAKKQKYGELYVMRCAAMKETIFKVGFTEGDSYERAKSLSSVTGVPLSFVVVKTWQHPDAEALETEVHMMLAPYRINDGREFFLARFDKIEKIIEATIVRTSGN